MTNRYPTVEFTLDATPDIECFDACSKGRGYYPGEQLPQLIAAVVPA